MSNVPRQTALARVIAVAVALTSFVGYPSAVAAVPSDDIPGIPLPGPVAAGRLGGAIYDVVYRFSVPPGHVIVASLTGTDGTDFDLYLFDSTATTVVSTAGQLTKSNGPTSTESISWPTQFGGTFYIDLNGATDVEGDYRLTVQTVPDSTPPTVSLTLAGGRTATNQVVVPVSITAAEDLSGVAEMAFSSDGATFGPWLAFASTSSVTIAPGDGIKRVWAKVKNGVGLESAPASATIALDTVGPSIVGQSPPPGSTVVGLRPWFRVSFDEAVDPASWIDLGLVVQSSGGGLVTGSYTYDAVARAGTFTPATDLQAGATYIVTVGNVRDVAGNPVHAIGSWTVVPLSPAKLAASGTPKVLLLGGSARIDLNGSGLTLPADIQVFAAAGAAPVFTAIDTVRLENGTGTITVTPTVNTTYRFTYAGAPGVAPAQVDLPILVRRSVALLGRNATVVSRARVGTTVTLTAVIAPPSAGVALSFRLYRFDAVRRAWVYAGSRGRSSDGAGRATLAWLPSSPGAYYWRVNAASTLEFANNVSAVYRWTVTR